MIYLLLILVIILLFNVVWQSFKRAELEHNIQVQLNRIWEELETKKEKDQISMLESDGTSYDERGFKV